MNRKGFMGLITITVIVGGTVYCIKKYKDSQKEEAPMTIEEAKMIVDELRDATVITLEEAKIIKLADDSRASFKRPDREPDELEQSTIKVAEAFGMNREEIDELIDEARDEVGWNRSFEPPESTPIEYDYYNGLDFTRPLSEYIQEEEKVLRFDPNTIQARDQFIKMELAELAPNSKEYQVMKRLFDFNFEPLNDGDGVLYTQLVDYRMEFFGYTSRWNDNISMGDIIVNYARLADYNLGGGIGTWIMEFIQNTDFNELSAPEVIEQTIIIMNQHKYIDGRTNGYSFFGLTSYSIDEAREMAEESIDGELTYDIEFNTFLKSMM